MMTFRCLIGQSLLLIHHHHFRSQISTIGPYHCIRNDQISWKQVWNRPNRILDGYDLIKTILAWWTAQIQSQIRLHIDSAAQNLIPRLDFKTARLNSARLGSARGWWCGRWVPLCWRVCWLVDDVAANMACLLCMLTSHLHQADVIPGMPTVHADITIMSCWRH
jgi:hypothetical protein